MVAGPETQVNKYQVKPDKTVQYITIITVMIKMFHHLPHCVIKGEDILLLQMQELVQRISLSKVNSSFLAI